MRESAAVKIIQAVLKICRITIRLIYFFMLLNKASEGGRQVSIFKIILQFSKNKKNEKIIMINASRSLSMKLRDICLLDDLEKM